MSAIVTPFRDRHDRQPLPRAIDSERCVLGAIAATEGAVFSRIGNLTADHFSTHRHRILFAAMRAEHEESGASE